MKTYKYADSKFYDPASPESLQLALEFAHRYPGIGSGRVFNAGKYAAQEGWTVAACPYLEHTPLYDEWRKGWRAGQ